MVSRATSTSDGRGSCSVWTARHPILLFVSRRALVGFATLIVASLVIFTAVSVLPGDVASNALGQRATPERLAELQAKLGLDQSVAAQYIDWLNGMVRGDFGDSAAQVAQGAKNAAVLAEISTPLRNSVILAAITTLIMIPIALTCGVLAGLRAGRRTDHGISTAALVLVAIPEFVLATLLIFLMSTQLDWLPPVSIVRPGGNPLSDPEGLVLPVLALLGITAASGIRMVRAGMFDALHQAYVEYARLNGVPERWVVWRHAIRNALAPSVQIIAQNMQYLFGGIIVVESVFAYSGLGRQLVMAIQARDAPEIQAIALIIATAYIVINIVADLLVMLLVPKLRTA